MTPPARIPGLSTLTGRYGGLLCDVWGVVHNGVAIFPGLRRAFDGFRESGGRVVLLTNAPRPNEPVIAQLDRLGLPREAYDGIVTSGDVTRGLVARGPSRVLHIGAAKDHRLFEGLPIERVGEDEAEGIVCTGLYDDATETPEDYHALWQRLLPRGLPMVCANPDIVVDFDDRLIWCAGALARDYAAMGGTVSVVGKPHRAIYEAALAEMARLGGPDDPARVLAVGDGLPTDVAGAAGAGLDCLYITAGIHAGDYARDRDPHPEHPDPERLAAFLAEKGVAAIGWMPRLTW